MTPLNEFRRTIKCRILSLTRQILISDVRAENRRNEDEKYDENSSSIDYAYDP